MLHESWWNRSLPAEGDLQEPIGALFAGVKAMHEIDGLVVQLQARNNGWFGLRANHQSLAVSWLAGSLRCGFPTATHSVMIPDQVLMRVLGKFFHWRVVIFFVLPLSDSIRSYTCSSQRRRGGTEQWPLKWPVLNDDLHEPGLSQAINYLLDPSHPIPSFRKRSPGRQSGW